MKKYLLTTILVASALCLHAENLMNVHMKGGMVSFPFVEKPVITFHTGTMTVSSASTVRWFWMSDVVKITYDEGMIPTAISSAITSSGVTLNGNTVIVSGLKNGEKVRMYSAAGALLDTQKADDQGVLVINPSMLPQGVIIIKSSKTSFKINN